MITHQEIRSHCLDLLNRQVVCKHQFGMLADDLMVYRIFAKDHQSYLRVKRLVQIVRDRHLRTSFSAAPYSQSQRRLIAFASHRAIEEKVSPKDVSNHHRLGRRITIGSGQYIRRFINHLVPDLFKPAEAFGFGTKPKTQGGQQPKGVSHV